MRLLFVAGGTAGPLTPLLAVAEELRRVDQSIECQFVIDRGDAERILVESAGFPSTVLSSGKLRRYFSLRNVADVVITIGALFRALRLLRTQQPRLVVTAGSFNGVPLGIAAWLLRIPVIVHQQDVQPGLANRLAAPFASSITLTFPESVRYFPVRKTQLTGNPVRSAILRGSAEDARLRFHLPADLPVVVVLGGSSGAAFINRLVIESKDALRNVCTIVHITGADRSSEAESTERYITIPFLTEGLGDLLAVADIVITRAGVGTLSELAALGKTAIIIPMPRTHQEANADAVARRRAAVVCPQSVLTDAEFVRIVTKLLAQEQQRRVLGQALHHLFPPDAARTLAQLLIERLV